MRDIWKKYNLLIASLFYLVVILTGGYFFLVPLIKDVAQNSEKVQEKIADNEIYSRRISQLEEMEKEYLKINGEKERLNIFLGNEQEVEFIRRLESLAGETGNVINFKVVENGASGGKTTEDGLEDKFFYKEFLPLEIELESDYNKIMLFLHKLENSPQYVNVISLVVEEVEPEVSILNPSSGMFSTLSSAPTIVSNQVSSGKVKASIKMVVYKK